MIHIKKALTFIIVLSLISTMIPAFISSAAAVTAVPRTKILNLVSQTTDTANSSEKWSWNAASKTLSVSGISFNVSAGNAIVLPAGATIAVTGNNTVKAPGLSASGIESQGSLTITGSGSLSVTAGHVAIFSLYSLNVQLSDLTANAPIGLWTDTDMNISPFKSSITAVLSGSLTVTSIMSNKVDVSTGGNINVSDNVSGRYGITLYALGDLNIKKGSNSLTSLMSVGFNSNILLAGTIPAGNTVIIEGNVQIPAGKTLINNGTISVQNGYTLTKYGSIINHGTITPDPVRVTASAVYVNGVDILKAPGYTVACGDGTAIFTPIDNTLTLNNAAITNGYQIAGNATAGIYADSTISINVIGNNSVVGSPALGYGVYISGGDLRSSGPGSMSAQGTKAAVYVEGTLYLSNELQATCLTASGAAIVIHRVSGYSQPFYPVILTGSIYPRSAGMLSNSGAYWTYGYSVSYDEATGFTGADQYVELRSRVTDTWFEIDFSIPTYKIGELITPVHIPSIAGEPPYTYTTSGLPEGLYVDDFGNIKGTPTKATPSGTAVITFTDANSRSFKMSILYGAVLDPNVSDRDNVLTLTTQAVLGDDGTAAARLTGAELSAALVSLPRTTGALHIALNVTVPENAHNLAVTLPAETLNSISDMKPDIKIYSQLGNVYIDRYRLQNVCSRSGSVDFTASIVYKTAADLNESQLHTVSENNINLETDNTLIVEPALKAGGTRINMTGYYGSVYFSIPFKFAKWQVPLLVPLDAEGGGEYIPMAAYDEKDHVILYDPLDAYLIYINQAAEYRNPYYDIYTKAWYADAVEFVTMRGLMNGTGDETFEPFANTTRGMMVTLLYRLEGRPAVTGKSRFSDVEDNAYYSDAVKWASSNNIVNGYGDKYGPNDLLTREQMVTILYRYTIYKNYESTASDALDAFNDKGKISTYALPAMRWSVAEGLVSGISPNEIAPQNNAQRSQIAVVLKRYVENIQQ